MGAQKRFFITKIYLNNPYLFFDFMNDYLIIIFARSSVNCPVNIFYVMSYAHKS